VKRELFRNAALQQLQVAERLDTAVQVVSPGAFLVVLATLAFISAAVVWAAVGRVPTRVYGEGLLLREGSIVDVTSMAEGQVAHMIANVGDLVKENDPIARIAQPELSKQRLLLEAKLDELTGKYSHLETLDVEGAAIKNAALKRQRAAVHYALKETKKQLAFFKDKLKADTALLEKGLTTPVAVAETRQRVLDLQAAIYAKQAEGRNIAFSALDAERSLEARRYDLAMQVSETKREIEELQKRVETQSVVLAKASGRVIEVKLTDGDAVTRGRPIATLEVAPHGAADLVAEIYIPAQDGKRVKAGMPIRLSPSVVKPEEDGYLEGVVDSVSPFPVSEQSMLRAVRNQNIVQALLKDGPVYEAHVRVITDAHTPSGLRWSNGHGPAIVIAGGTPVHGLVTVKTRRPIELVIPALERLVTDVPAGEKRR
jgi:HlyD family secretion protein